MAGGGDSAGCGAGLAGNTKGHGEMELGGEARERIREAVRDALSRDDMSEDEIADMAVEMTVEAMSGKDWRENKAASFQPASWGVDDDTLPYMKVAGALVFAYVRDGELRVSVDLDDAGESRYWPAGQACTPLQLSVQGTTVYKADAEGKEERGLLRGLGGRLLPFTSTEQDAKTLRKFGGEDAEDAASELLLCDQDYELGAGVVAVCQDGCNLSLDHDGECADVARAGRQLTCDRCGEQDRLTRVDARDVEFDR